MSTEPTMQPQLNNVVESTTAIALRLGAPHAHPLAPYGYPYVLLPEGTVLQPLPPEQRPPRKTGNVVVHDVESFVVYVQQHRTAYTVIYGSMKPAKFEAVLNDHEGGAEGLSNWRDHRCSYPLEHSIEWTTWNTANRQPFGGNKEFAEWLEDNLPDIIDPPANQMMDMALGFSVTAGAAFSNPVDLDTGSTQLAYTHETRQGVVTIPKRFTIEIPVFRGINAGKFRVEARFRYKMRDGGVELRYELIRPHKVIEEAFKAELEFIRAKAAAVTLFGEAGASVAKPAACA